MSALPDTVVPFQLPAKKPRIKEHEPLPDQRKASVMPIRACTDKQLTHGMLKVLMLVCSYTNRAGITWVSQAKLASQLEVTQQAVSKHLVKLTKAGYLEVLKRPIPGQKHTTWRVIFDPNISAEDAVAITSSIEDTRPPYMKEEQQNQTPDPEGQRRIAQLIAKALRQPTKPPERTMPQPGESITVKKMKAEIEAHKKKQKKPPVAQPPEVVQPPSSVAQPFEGVSTTSKELCKTSERGISKVIRQLDVLNNQQIKKLIEAGMNEQQIQEAADFLLPIYKAEGLTPTPDLLADSILQLHRDAA